MRDPIRRLVRHAGAPSAGFAARARLLLLSLCTFVLLVLPAFSNGAFA